MAYRYLKDGTKMTKPDCEYNQRSYQAVMDFRETKPDATREEVAKVLAAYNEVKAPVTGYATYTAIKQACRLPYPRIFAVVKTLHVRNPGSIICSVNRLNENTRCNLNHQNRRG